MRIAVALLTLSSFCAVNAQFNEGVVYFKDSTSSGLIKVKSFGGIKFKPSENAVAIDYDYNQINGCDVNGWQYRYEKKSSADVPKLFKLILEGEISLYKDEISNSDSTGSNGLRLQPYNTPVYFIKVEKELIRVGSKLKSRHLEIFDTCPLLIQKIKQYDIVEFYNENCN